MEEMNNKGYPWSNMGPQQVVTPPPVRQAFTFPTGIKEQLFAFLALACGLMMCNFVLYGGFELGFGIAMCAYIVCAAGYLLASGGRHGHFRRLRQIR